MNYVDPSGHEPKYGDGACYEIDCKNANGTEVKDGNGKGGKSYLFKNLPVGSDEINGVQWFGGTYNAFLLMSQGENIYEYCHYFHCGLDILAEWGTQVTAGLNGEVIYAGCDSGRSEGPCKVQITVGDYVVTYGHLSGMPLVVEDQIVNPGTILGGVGTNSQSANNSNLPDPNKNFPHIHLEIRGPGGWGGPSINPLQFMSQSDITLLTNIAETQSDTTMSQFHDGTNFYSYPPPSNLMPNQIIRYGNNSFFP